MTTRTTVLIILALAAWFLYWMGYQADATEHLSYEETCEVPEHAQPWIVNNGDTLVMGTVSSDASWTRLTLYSATEEQYYQWPIPNGRYTLKGLETWTLCWQWINRTTTTTTTVASSTTTTTTASPTSTTTTTTRPATTLTVPYQTPQGLWTVKRPVNVSAF